MIKNQWYAVLDSKEVKRGKIVGVTRLNEKLIFWRDSLNMVHCLADRCCHRGASLSLGRVCDGAVECPFHGFIYDSSGKVVTIPANGNSAAVDPRYNVKSYAVRDAYGFIWLWYGDHNDSLPAIPFFEDLRNNFSYGQLKEVWSVDYTRAIENQLDVVHLPFVHATTIGKGRKTVVNGPVVKWQENLMTFYVDNEVDIGQSANRAEDILDYEKLFRLQLQMPNTWQNIISDNVRVMAAFAPIDDENTMIYLRFYQKIIKFPLLKQFFNFIGGSIVNRIILHQDRRVVRTQIPKKSSLKMDEKLIPGDLPIIEYRKRREQLFFRGD